MRNIEWLVGTALITVLIGAVSGCGMGSSTAEGTGKVTYKGTAVTAGEVNFISKEKGVGAVTTIDSSGTFQLPDGLVPGQYAVSVSPPLAAPPPPGTRVTPTVSPIPLKARDPATSGVTVALKPGGNEVVVDLKD